MEQFNWQRQGRIFDPRGRFDWMQGYSQVPTILIKGDIYRIFFTTRSKRDEQGQFISRIGYADFDRNNPQKMLGISERPIIDLGKPGTHDEFGMMPGCTIEHEGVLRMYYTGWTRSVSVPFMTSIGVLESKDNGDSWYRLGDGPVLGRTLQEPYLENGPYVLKKDGLYHMWYASSEEWVASERGYEAMYVIKHATSTDGLVWSRDAKKCVPEVLSVECNGRPTVIEIEGIYHMWFCYRHGTDFRGKEGGYRMGYASSTDLINWDRNDELAGMELSNEGWDSEMLAYPQIFNDQGKLIMLYNGNYFGEGGFGLATIDLNNK